MSKKHIKVLLIEDNAGDVRLIWEILSEVRNSPFYLSVADSLLNGLKEIEKQRPDIILLDLSLGDSNGIYTLNRVRDKAKNIPIVILTGMDDEMTAMKALDEGAQDYLVKGRTDSDLLKKAIIYSIQRFKLIAQLEEKQAILKEQDEIKYNYLLMIFHELLIPASAIRSAIGLVEKSAESKTLAGDNTAELHSVIRNNTQSIFSLLDDLINVSEIAAGSFAVKLEEVKIADLVDKIYKDTKVFAVDKNITIKVNNVNETEFAFLDGRRMIQAVNNLIINSVKFSEPQSVITLSVSKFDIKDANLPAYISQASPFTNDYLVISVKDEGSGISDELRTGVFDTFFSSKTNVPTAHKGIGLGLIITKNIISKHNGYMWVTSEGINKGSIFNIIIPLIPKGK